MTLRKLLLALLLAPLLSAPVGAEENLVTFKSMSRRSGAGARPRRAR